ncbi:protein kinase [Candidatus Berkiella cookevillensis]|uniref:Protein kinase n=1 Tax=Candidatus Berkiella cookevillensis TaxID=437022 RepID=A0A0Q9YH51_9GAMM|nr:protein kinase [Candidatus Berkiella cookevillensis]MCS5708481.1 protein kinase [Candidatus Berkiella cookevillensis]
MLGNSFSTQETEPSLFSKIYNFIAGPTVPLVQKSFAADFQSFAIQKFSQVPVLDDPMLIEEDTRAKKRSRFEFQASLKSPDEATNTAKRIRREEPAQKQLTDIAEKPIKKIKRKRKIVRTPVRKEIDLFSALGRFVQRLRNNANKNVVPDLLEDIFFQDDLKNIFEYVINYVTRNVTKLSNLVNGKSIRLNKGTTKLARNLQISKSASGKLRLFVETNRKSKMGTKDLSNALLGKGTFKTVLRCYQLDSDIPKTWACSKIKSEIREAISEAELTNQLVHPHIAHFEIGTRYKNGKKITLYSKLAIGTLEDVINGNISCSPEEKEILMMQIMDAVAFTHAKNVVHQDIKPQNILIYRDKSGALVAKLSDFGISVKNNRNIHAPLSTLGYESPQILAYYQDRNSEQYNYYFSNSLRTLGKDVFNRFKDQIIEPGKACPSNDCWALGVMYYELMHGKKPTISIVTYAKKSGNPIIDGLLRVHANDRLDSATALEQIKQRCMASEQSMRMSMG